MSKHYNAPRELRPLEKLLRDFSYTNGYNIVEVFNDFLEYVVHQFTIPAGQPLENWRYTSEQSSVFLDMFCAWSKIMNAEIEGDGWYDPFGDLFISITSLAGQQGMGQFFTPKEICDLMSMIVGSSNTDSDYKSKTCYDPACGSGRNLLAEFSRSPKTYMVGWDIDMTCCLMTVCNFLIHGCVGHIVCINTLSMTPPLGAWLVNGALYRTGLPSVQKLTNEELNAFVHAEQYHTLFYDQETYDTYWKYKKIWAHISAIFDDAPSKAVDFGNDNTAESAEENL